MKRSILLWLITTVTILCLLAGGTLPTSAETVTEAVTMPPAYTSLPESIPPELEALLPDGLFSEDAEEALTAAETLTDWRYLLNALASSIGLGLEDTVRLLCVLVGLILLSVLLPLADILAVLG